MENRPVAAQDDEQLRFAAQVGNGKAGARVPSVLGMTAVEARAALRSAGFDPRVIVQAEPPAPDSSEHTNQVWKQNPVAGASAPQGTTVTVWVNPQGVVQPVSPEQETTTTG